MHFKGRILWMNGSFTTNFTSFAKLPLLAVLSSDGPAFENTRLTFGALSSKLAINLRQNEIDRNSDNLCFYSR